MVGLEEDEQASNSFLKKILVENSVDRMTGDGDAAIREWLESCKLATFQAEVDRRGGIFSE